MNFDLIIIGAGPGGYEMASKAASRGIRVAIIERDLAGGTCLNRGCIPTKALCRNAEVVNLVREAAHYGVSCGDATVDYNAIAHRKDTVVEGLREGVTTLLSRPGITYISGEARFVSPHEVEVAGERYGAPSIVIATGSAPKGLPITGAELTVSSDDLLAMRELPKSLCVIGGGVIGMEFASIFHSFGTEVTVVEYCKEILPPFDKDIAKRLRQTLGKRGVNIVVDAAVTGISGTEDNLQVSYVKKGKTEEVSAQVVLMAVGRNPVVPDGAIDVGIAVSPRGIEVDSNFETTVKGVYAVGDVNGKCMLAHAATAQAMRVLDLLSGAESGVDLSVVPSAVFTVPEVAMVGLTEVQCEVAGISVVVKKSFFRSNGKAVAMGEPDGLVKMIVDTNTRRIVGCHILGAHASDLIAEVALAMNSGLTVDAIAWTIHGHPTLGEVVKTAAEQFCE